MIGKTIGLLTVVELDSLKSRPGAKGKRARYWQCECSCGKTYIANTNTLNSGRVVSCGCKKKENGMLKRKPKIVKQRVAHNFSGYEGLSGDYVGNIKRKAKARKISFDESLTARVLWDLLVSQDFRCKLSGLPIKTSRNFKNNLEQTASLDRIDSKKSYTLENVQWVHKDVNWLKNRFDQGKFVELCRLVAYNNSDASSYT